MDLRAFFRKVREKEQELLTTTTGQHLIVASLETPDGGRPGVLTEVSRLVAARLIVEGKATLANPEEMLEYYERAAAARQAAEEDSAALDAFRRTFSPTRLR